MMRPISIPLGLITTVVGMAARIYMTQFDAITTEPEAETLASIGTLSANLEKALITLNESSANNLKIMNLNLEPLLILGETMLFFYFIIFIFIFIILNQATTTILPHCS